MPMETDHLTQKAVLWAKSGNGRDGLPTVSAGVEIDVRWETASDEDISDQDVAAIASDILMTDQEIELGSILWKGELTSVPDSPTNLREVVAVEYIPDVKGNATQYTVILARYANELPQIA